MLRIKRPTRKSYIDRIIPQKLYYDQINHTNIPQNIKAWMFVLGLNCWFLKFFTGERIMDRKVFLSGVVIFFTFFSLFFCVSAVNAETKLDQALNGLEVEMKAGEKGMVSSENNPPAVAEPAPVLQQDVEKLRREVEKAYKELKRARLSSLSVSNVSREARSASVETKTALEGYEAVLEETKTAAVETMQVTTGVKTAIDGLQEKVTRINGAVERQEAKASTRFWLLSGLVAFCCALILFWITFANRHAFKII